MNTSSNTTSTNCHVMAKPSGSICNLDCEYCFYLEKEKLYPERNENWRMSDETLEMFIRQQIEAQSGHDVDIAWQGGEPTLMGVEFFEKAAVLAKKYSNGKRIHHAFQTNGILINDEWCELFKRHDFLIGISIDGPEELHDKYRVTRSGKVSHHKVMRGIGYLKKHGVPFNTLTVVNNFNAFKPIEVYRFLKSIGSSYMQFIPLVEQQAVDINDGELTLVPPEFDKDSKVTKWSVPSWQYGEFLNQIFDEWVRKDVGKVFVQTFDSTLSSWCNQPAGICIFSPTCGNAFALEANGDLYCCDHFVYPEFKLGNIHQQSVNEMNNSDKAVKFGKDKKERLTADCQKCKFRFACHGGCPKHRFIVSDKGFPFQNYLCKGYLHYFEHTAPYMAAMRDLVKSGHHVSEVIRMVKASDNKQIIAKVGRNVFCPCGSGKKYKQCCGKNK